MFQTGLRCQRTCLFSSTGGKNHPDAAKRGQEERERPRFRHDHGRDTVERKATWGGVRRCRAAAPVVVAEVQVVDSRRAAEVAGNGETVGVDAIVAVVTVAAVRERKIRADEVLRSRLR